MSKDIPLEALNITSSALSDRAIKLVNHRELHVKRNDEDVNQYDVNDQETIQSVQNNNSIWFKTLTSFKKYLRFIGPGLMVSVAYMDPGNYSTSVSAGASNRYSLLFVVLLSNIIAIFYQSLCVKLGTVTGLDLSRACREYLPPWLNYTIYVFAEASIIATDIAEVIGSAIALNILLKIPLWAGVLLTITDVLIVMMAYRPGSSIKFVKLFEYMVALLVLIVVVCFCVQLAFLPDSTSVRSIFRGYAPSHEMIEGNGIYIAVSVIGATVMPHSLFLGSALVQPRLREFDIKNKFLVEDKAKSNDENYYSYKPSYKAIKYSYKYSIIELAVTLFTFALFVNSAILIVSGSLLYVNGETNVDADLYSIYDLLSSSIAPAIGTLFMCALLASGQSAGIVCTMAGQIVCEGHIKWSLTPWIRRIVTRLISIIPCLIVSLCIGKSGLSKALNASQVVLSILLPFLVAPLIYFTSYKKFMKIEISQEDYEIEEFKKSNNFFYKYIVYGKDSLIKDTENNKYYKDMSNNFIVTGFCIMFWILVSIMNVYAIYSAAKNGV